MNHKNVRSGNPLSLKVTKEEREQVKILAEEDGRDVSSYIRRYGIHLPWEMRKNLKKEEEKG